MLLFTSLRVGDQIASVNGIELLVITHSEAVTILKDTFDPIHLVCRLYTNPCQSSLIIVVAAYM